MDVGTVDVDVELVVSPTFFVGSYLYVLISGPLPALLKLISCIRCRSSNSFVILIFCQAKKFII